MSSEENKDPHMQEVNRKDYDEAVDAFMKIISSQSDTMKEFVKALSALTEKSLKLEARIKQLELRP